MTTSLADRFLSLPLTQDGRHSLCTAAGPGEEPDAAEWSGLQGARVQNQLPRARLYLEERGCWRHLHRVGPPLSVLIALLVLNSCISRPVQNLCATCMFVQSDSLQNRDSWRSAFCRIPQSSIIWLVPGRPCRTASIITTCLGSQPAQVIRPGCLWMQLRSQLSRASLLTLRRNICVR